MKNTRLTLIVMALCLLAACGPTAHEKAFKLFNEGVALSLDAANALANNDSAHWHLLTDSAIIKYKAALQADSNYRGARGALGNSYYQLKNYGEAVTWLQQANQKDGEVAEVHREIGLCKINQGQLQAGRVALFRSFQLDSSKTIKTLAVDDLLDIGVLAFQFGRNYQAQADTTAAHDYQMFAIGVLLTANQIDSTRTDVRDTLSTYANLLGDKDIIP